MSTHRTAWRALCLALNLVVAPGASVLGAAVAHAQAALVDLNSASEKELEDLKGVGKATAKKIVAHRPYQSIEELSRAGLSAKKIDALRPLVSLGGSPVPAAVPEAKKQAAAAAKEGKDAADDASKEARSVKERLPTGPVDINSASEKDLEGLKGVGAATAKKIVANRPYGSADDLSKAGIHGKRLDALKPLITVGGARAALPAAPSAPPAALPTPEAPAPSLPAAPSVPAVAAPSVQAPAVPSAERGLPRAPKLAPGQVVNLNTASKEVLDELPGIGPVKAQAIIDGRPYAKIEDVMKVKGIKEGEFSKIKSLITVQ